MKKLTALVLALMLVFAAGSALALTNREAVPVDGQVIGSTTLSILTMSPLGFAVDSTINWAVYGLGTDTTYSVGQDVIFLAQFQYANEADDLTVWWDQWNSVKIACTNMVFKGIAAAGVVDSSNKVKATLATTIVNNTGTSADIRFRNTTPTAFNAARQLNVVFTAAIVAADPSLSVQAKWGPGMEFTTAMLNTTYTLFEKNSKGKYEDSGLRVLKTTPAANAALLAPNVLITALAAAATTATDQPIYVVTDGIYNVAFVLKQDRGLVDAMYIQGGTAYGAAYAQILRTTNVGGTSSRNWASVAGAAMTEAAAITFLDDVFDVLGFSWTMNGAVWDEDFLKYANFEKDAVSAAPNMLSATVPEDPDDGEIDGGEIDIPPTGDVASTFGFVMIGVAILATASLAIVAKKAR